MSFHFHQLRVKEIIRETPDANTIVFEKPAEGFDYFPGQYLTLKFEINGESLRRAYSLCSSPVSDQGVLAVTVKRVEGGKVSNYVGDQLKAGDMVDVMRPMGKFHIKPNAGNQQHYVLLGAGSGITPLMSIIKTVLEAEPASKVTLLYGNRNQDCIIFNDTLKQLEEQHADRFRIVHLLSRPEAGWNGITARLDKHQTLNLVQEVLNKDNLPKSYWICGPSAMMEEVQTGLNFLGIPKQEIHQEYFNAPLPEPGKHEHEAVAGEATTHIVKVILDDKEYEFSVPPEKTILDVAVEEGLDPPFACQLGVCCTCRAKIKSGMVSMDETEGLSDTEIDDGYILTCQAHPLTPDVVVEYM